MALSKQKAQTKKAIEARKVAAAKRKMERQKEAEISRAKRRKCGPSERRITPTCNIPTITTSCPTAPVTASQIYFSNLKTMKVLHETPVSSKEPEIRAPLKQSDTPIPFKEGSVSSGEPFRSTAVPESSNNLVHSLQQTPTNSKITLVKRYPTPGRRIISSTSLHICMQRISDHAKTCPRFDLRFDHETNFGMECKLHYVCKCGYTFEFASSSSKESLPLNTAVAVGGLSSAVGFDDMTRFLTPLDLKTCSKHTFRQHQLKYKGNIQLALKKSMALAAQEEMRLAFEAGDVIKVNQREYPWICVIVDGSWAKRSYGHSYNSNYGMAAIIGRRTKKVLFVGHRQKVCSRCQKTAGACETKGIKCQRNWNGPSTAMEPDIILEGFQQSIEKYGLVYKEFIGDGDSSVYNRIQHVYPGITVDKVECCNHVIRNMNTKLREIANDSYKRRKITIVERRMEGMEQRFQRVGRAVMGSIKYYNERLPDSTDNNWEDLAADIRNIPNHIFGRHVNCRTYFCETKKALDQGIPFVCEKDFVHEIRDTQLFQAVKEVLERPAQLARSLVRKLSSNLVESFMAVVAKYLNGKRCNLGARELYEVKVASAALSYNQSPFWAYDVYKSHCVKSPHANWKKLKSSQLVDRARGRTNRKLKPRKVLFQFPKGKKGDVFYGTNPSRPDLPEVELQLAIAQKRAELQVDVTRQQEISSRTSSQVNNPEWFKERRDRVTASAAKRVYKLSPKTDNTGILNELLRNSNFASEATKWGRNKEKTAISHYELTKGLPSGTVKPCGLIVSLQNGIFAASPDGLVGDEGLLEVKCPFMLINVERKDWANLKKSCIECVNGAERLKMNHEYFYQVIMQLFVTQRQWVDFFVWSPKGYFLQRIEANTEMRQIWQNMVPKLETFWVKDLAPELVDSRISRGYTEYRCSAERLVDRSKKLERKNAKKILTTSIPSTSQILKS